MAALDLQEQEQLEELKAWWKDNRNFILGALLIAFVSIGGWRGWQYYHQNQSIQAAVLYSEFVRQLQGNDAGRVNDAAAAVMDRFPSTAYASRAALLAAQANENVKDSTRAKAQLQWVIDHAGEADLRDVARLRLASLFLDDAKYTDAMGMLNAEHSPAFDGLFADLRGDVLSAEGKTDEARSAYKLAFEKTDPNSTYRNLIKMKLDALVTSK